MDESKAARRRQNVKYVAKILQLNPVERSGDIVRLRSRALGLVLKTSAKSAAVEPAPVDPRVQRQEISKAIESIRANFWTTSLPELKESLSRIRAQEFPDLQSSVQRLSVVAAHRGQLPRLTSEKGFDSNFFKVFRDVLVASQRESAINREKMLAQCGKRKTRRRVTKMIDLIRRELPAVYELEADWLESLTRQRNSTVSVRKSDDDKWERMERTNGIPWWVWVLGLLLLRGIARALRE